ncbi:hypothetical protein [Gordonia sputi]
MTASQSKSKPKRSRIARTVLYHAILLAFAAGWIWLVIVHPDNIFGEWIRSMMDRAIV